MIKTRKEWLVEPSEGGEKVLRIDKILLHLVCCANAFRRQGERRLGEHCRLLESTALQPPTLSLSPTRLKEEFFRLLAECVCLFRSLVFLCLFAPIAAVFRGPHCSLYKVNAQLHLISGAFVVSVVFFLAAAVGVSRRSHAFCLASWTFS